MSFIEQQWWEANQDVTRRHHDHAFVCRSVDNRLVGYSEHNAHCSWRSKLCQFDVYEKPVGLAEVESGEFLGTVLHPAERCLAFVIPIEQHQFKPMISARRASHKLAAVNSRVCLASWCSHSQSQREQDVKSVSMQYVPQQVLSCI